MNVLTRTNGSFLTADDERQRNRRPPVLSSHIKRHKRRRGIYDFPESHKDKVKGGMYVPRHKISAKALDLYLYGSNDVSPVKMEEGSPEEEAMRQRSVAVKIPNFAEKSVDILQLRYKPGVEKEFRSSEEFNKVLAAIKCIPTQLYLCYSSIPGAGFGICATEIVRSGTWIGPYEGKRVSIEEIGSMIDSRYVWEIYKNGVLDHGIDGIELQGESSWCWMKYIQCARNAAEQNTVAFQFGADIYFQTYKTIKPGEELLVWYAEYYEQHHGIPVGVRKIAKNGKKNFQTATSTTDIIERAKRSISQIAPTSNSTEHPPLMKPQTLYPTATTHPPLLKPRPIKSPEIPPTPTVTNEHFTLSPESQPPPTKSEKSRSLFRFPKEEQNSTFLPLLRNTAVSQDRDLGQGLHTFKTRFWKCDHCLSKFPQKWALQVHRCPCEVTKAYVCSNCEKAYVSKDDAQAHASRCGGGRQYKCAYCRRSFLNVNILSKHLKEHRKGATRSFKKKAFVPVRHGTMAQ